jgi:protein SCO1
MFYPSRALRGVAAVAGLLVASAFIAACDQVAPKFNSIDITGADYARGFELNDFEGKKRTLADFKGNVVAVFFGFTQCPDICPTAMLEMAQIKQSIGANAEKLQVVFITVDPERDTGQVLKAYLGNFDKQAIGLRGSLDETTKTAKEFKAFYAKVAGKTPDSYTLDHTAGFYVFDKQGRIRLFARHGADPKLLTADLSALLK